MFRFGILEYYRNLRSDSDYCKVNYIKQFYTSLGDKENLFFYQAPLLKWLEHRTWF